MKVTCEPTPELDELTINGVQVPMRIWHGVTAGGCKVELMVLSVIPSPECLEEFEVEKPDFMKKSRTVMHIGGFPDERGGK